MSPVSGIWKMLQSTRNATTSGTPSLLALIYESRLGDTSARDVLTYRCYLLQTSWRTTVAHQQHGATKSWKQQVVES